MKIKNKNQQAIVEWVNNSKTKFNYAATLTFPNDTSSQEQAKKICSQFCNFYNSELGYKNYKRKVRHDKTKAAPIYASLEGDGQVQDYHYHLALYKPESIPDWKFELLVKYCWKRATFSEFCKTYFKPITNNGWLSYITKQVSSTNTDSLDEINTNIH